MANITPEYVVGVDIGGTNIVAAVVHAAEARVLSRRSIPTEAERGPEDGMRRVGDTIEQAICDVGLTSQRIGGIGIGCTGPVDSVLGRVHNPYTLPTWDDVPLVDALVARFDLPTSLLHDCAAAALGEYWVGTGRGTRHMIYITVGTGIGAGIILDGRLYRGVSLQSGEVGHTVIDVNGPVCYCGARGCWEMLAAGPAIARLAAERATEDSLLLQLSGGGRDKITARIVSEAAMQGDPTATAVMEQTAVYLGVGIANLLNIFCPEVVVMGGGVMQSWSLLEPTMLQTIRSRGRMAPFDQMRIVQASLGLNAGVMGAARGLLDHLEGRL